MLYYKEISPHNDAYLPVFELKTLKAVQTQAGEKDGRFANWFEVLEYMHEQTMNIDFDIALIGCGAYGYTLTSMIKKTSHIFWWCAASPFGY